VINGPNLNNLGNRSPKHYGKLTLDKIIYLMRKHSENTNIKFLFYQSNHEGRIIDFIQKKVKEASGIIINPGALTHYGYSLKDALIDTNLPIVEVHLSEIKNREKFRKLDICEDIVISVISGLKEDGYLKAIDLLISYLNK